MGLERGWIDGLGVLAGLLTTLAFVPQVLKTWRRRSAEDVSTGMFVLFSTGVFLWLIYGWLIQSLPIQVANAVTLLLAISVLVMKYRFRRSATQPSRDER